MLTEQRRCAVIGSPVNHSLSPVMHRAAYAHLGLDWTYEAIEVRAGGTAAFIAGLDPQWRGLSVTMPLKPELLELPKAQVSERARIAGVANTVILDRPDTSLMADTTSLMADDTSLMADDIELLVDNTDIPGLARALQRRVPGRSFDEALVVGTGATARSAVLALTEGEVSRILVTGRSPAKVAALLSWANGFGATVEPLAWEQAVPASVELVICSLPGEALDAAQVRRLSNSEVTFDISYHPWPSALARASRGTVLSGLDLLADQAVLQLQQMTGQTVPVEVLLDAVCGTPPT